MATRQEYAEMTGWALSLINSSYELRQIFNRGAREDWDVSRLVAAFRNTRWFKRHSESWRKDQVLRRTDPGEWKAQRSATWAALRDQAAQMGATISSTQMARITNNVMQMGLSEAQVRNVLAGYVKFTGGLLHGQAAVTGDTLRTTALNNGYKLADSQLQSWARAIARGDRTVEDYQDWIRERAAKNFTAFGAQLKAGEDLRDLASPYIDSMATLWERNPNDIDMFDPTLRKALNWTNPDSGKVEAMSTSDFEAMLRRSKNWQGTDNARDASDAFVRDLGRVFGLAS